MPGLLIMLLALLLVAGVLLLPAWRNRRIRRTPFPDTWLTILENRIPVYSALPGPLQAQLQELVKLFMQGKTFIGCAGLEMSEDIRVTIAGEACLLLLNRPSNLYRKVSYIYVYPTGFITERDAAGEDGVVTRERRSLLGEAWSSGKVILSWDDVEQGARNFNDGNNVVLHEFAHQLDSESGATNGSPVLSGSSCVRSWAKVLSREFESLQRKARRGEKADFNTYGATNPAEFFAVATEYFFEQPEMMKRKHPALFDELFHYYRVDPCLWVE